MKKCLKCKKKKKKSDFSKNKEKPDGLNIYCRECQKVYRAEMYSRYSKKARARIKQRKKELKDWYISFKKTLQCDECGDSRYYVLDFHHTDPKSKKMDIAQMIRNGYSLANIMKEILKCKVLCSNCHREERWKTLAGVV